MPRATTSGPRLRCWRPGWPVDLARTLAPLAHGRSDPTMRIGPDGVWRASRSPLGPATAHYALRGEVVEIRAWGPGAEHAVDTAADLLGAGDDPTGFAADEHPVMAAAHARFGAGWRVARTGQVLEALVPAVLEQRVTGREAAAAWRDLVGRFGHAAPGAGGDPQVPADLMVAPDADGWRRVPSWAWHRAGVDPGRAGTIVRAAGRAQALEALCDRDAPDATAALRALPGVGIWTAAEVGLRAWGDRDAVSFGDFHLAGAVVHALTGQRGGTDAQMEQLLRPWAGQRARAVRLLEMHCGFPPRRGPRAAITDHRRH